MLERFAFDPRTIGRELDAENALDADHVAVEKVAVEIIRPCPAGDHPRSGAGPRGTAPELFHAGVFAGEVDVTAERRREIVGVAGGIGDEVVAPIVEDFAVRVGETVGNVSLESVGQRLESIEGAVGVPNRAGGGFDLRAMEHTVAKIGGTAGIAHHRVGRVVRVGGIDAVENALFKVGVIVSFSRFHIPQIRRLHEQNAVLVKGETGRAVQAVDEMCDFVGVTGALGVFKNKNAVTDFVIRGALRVGAPRGNPQTALGVPGHLHGLDQFRKLRLIRPEADLHTLRRGHVLDRLFTTEERLGIGLVCGDFFNRGQVVILHL